MAQSCRDTSLTLLKKSASWCIILEGHAFISSTIGLNISYLFKISLGCGSDLKQTLLTLLVFLRNLLLFVKLLNCRHIQQNKIKMKAKEAPSDN
ncbi:hypothetical protein BpHYR1_012430 [Brachionus plicatilis]|uniref:Uncharacterized protein n=1 Tax=Brachionus plicatilis TaxID=10195 RepID=A0A3M7SNA1_BRAPC|nr:hypothetical protein BpHYR1_012430 [Brachionus plicatilis]